MISLLIPTIRPLGRERCVKAIEDTCKGLEYEILADEDVERIGCPKMVAKLLAKAKGDKVVFLGDDTQPQAGWLQEALRAETYLPDGWGLVGLNDGREERINLESTTHFLLDRRLLPLIGGEIFHTGYWHCFCDNELTLRARLLGRYAYATDARIEHFHPLSKHKAEPDSDYARVYSKEYWQHDEQLWRVRRELILNGETIS